MRKRGEIGREIRLMLALGASMVAIAGCAGSTGGATARSRAPAGGSTTATGISKPDPAFIAKAEAICMRLNKAIEPTAVRGLNAGKLAAFAPGHLVLERKALAELSRLRVPASMGSDWREIIGYRETLASELAQIAVAAKARDTTAMSTLAASKHSTNQELSTIATRDGFTACSRIG